MSPSYHHAYLCGKIITALNQRAAYAIFSELTIQIQEKDYVPDVCVYPKRPMNFVESDIIKMTEIPLMVIEVLSPSQGSQDALSKFQVYFDAGVKSCWLVIPISTSVIIYTAMDRAQTFHTGEIHDPVLDVRIPLSEIFS
ncbi:protein containing DUF820 [Candidatus Moduliflexus flocculans]|uniref:Protein containing DUF820 n=1 Tax=Candidatus Moduliflexus flocculans TaxID=1499966 RepID=A0A0S6W3F2_9BACT|nr:protein containing DUF820 [Candidatus Moduliflexus flocculans]